MHILWLEELYSYTEKITKTRRGKNRGTLCTANNYIYIYILVPNISIQAVQLIY